MSPHQLRIAMLRSRLDEMRALLADLDQLGVVSAEELRADRFRRHVTERVLSAMVDLGVGVNSHIVAVMRSAVPADAAATFDVMADLRILPAELALALRGSVGLRNAVVHDYADINLDLVAAAVPVARRQYEDYVRAVAGWLIGRSQAQDG